jgi:hypothetical protein
VAVFVTCITFLRKPTGKGAGGQANFRLRVILNEVKELMLGLGLLTVNRVDYGRG